MNTKHEDFLFYLGETTTYSAEKSHSKLIMSHYLAETYTCNINNILKKLTDFYSAMSLTNSLMALQSSIKYNYFVQISYTWQNHPITSSLQRWNTHTVWYKQTAFSYIGQRTSCSDYVIEGVAPNNNEHCFACVGDKHRWWHNVIARGFFFEVHQYIKYNSQAFFSTLYTFAQSYYIVIVEENKSGLALALSLSLSFTHTHTHTHWHWHIYTHTDTHTHTHTRAHTHITS